MPAEGLAFDSTDKARLRAGQSLKLQFYCSSVEESASLETVKSLALVYLPQWEYEQLLTDQTVHTSSCFGNSVWTSGARVAFTASFAAMGSTKRERSEKAETDSSFQEKLTAKFLYS